MWAPNMPNARSNRSSSVHSIASNFSNSQAKSIISSHSQRHSKGGYDSDQASEATLDDDRVSVIASDNGIPAMWQAPVQQSPPTLSLVDQKLGNEPVHMIDMISTPVQARHQEPAHHSMDDEAASQASTMDGAEEEFVEPKKLPKSLMATNLESVATEPRSPAPAPYVPGPLESQLAALMSKLIYIEQKQPTIFVQPEEYQELQARVKALEEEKKTWWKRHEAIWALRDEDVENNIKIRGLLAKARRDLEATQKLREEDLINVQVVRAKLAEKTRELERVQAQAGRSSPGRTRPVSYIERRDTTDLFTAAKIAALEQRTLELEKRNSDLVAQLESSKPNNDDDAEEQQTEDLDALNRKTAHAAWKHTVTDLEAEIQAKDAEIIQLRSSSGSVTIPASSASSVSAADWHRLESMFDEHSNYREAVGGKLQALRSEKETLQRELHKKEDECHVLEVKVQGLQRRVKVA